MNEVVVDRGAAMSPLEVEVWVDGRHVTNVQADSLILATPSGSTAYSMSSGGPIVSPSVPCLLITPVAPHSLSFRPIVVPDTSIVDIRVPDQARNCPRASFDAHGRVRLARGSFVRCYAAAFPLPTLSPHALDQDWYGGITEKLGWNHQIRVHRESLETLASIDDEDVVDDVAEDGSDEEGGLTDADADADADAETNTNTVRIRVTETETDGKQG